MGLRRYFRVAEGPAGGLCGGPRGVCRGGGGGWGLSGWGGGEGNVGGLRSRRGWGEAVICPSWPTLPAADRATRPLLRLWRLSGRLRRLAIERLRVVRIVIAARWFVLCRGGLSRVWAAILVGRARVALGRESLR